jgi:excisionase family DNA binding protein
MTDEPDLLTIRQAATRLAISRATTYRLIAAGHLRTIHVGRGRRIITQSLTDYVRHQETTRHN